MNLGLFGPAIILATLAWTAWRLSRGARRPSRANVALDVLISVAILLGVRGLATDTLAQLVWLTALLALSAVVGLGLFRWPELAWWGHRTSTAA